MATPSPRNRPVAVYDPGNRETWGESDFERRQRLPIGADSNANPTGAQAGRSTMDPARLAGMISRGTARPGQVAAAQFANEMARGAAALKGQQIGNEASQFKLEAEKQGLGALLRAYQKFMEDGGTLPATGVANNAGQKTTPQATGPGVPMQPSITTPSTPSTPPSMSGTSQNISTTLNPYGLGSTGIDLGATPTAQTPTWGTPTTPKKNTAQNFVNQFNPYGISSTGLTF